MFLNFTFKHAYLVSLSGVLIIIMVGFSEILIGLAKPRRLGPLVMIFINKKADAWHFLQKPSCDEWKYTHQYRLKVVSTTIDSMIFPFILNGFINSSFIRKQKEEEFRFKILITIIKTHPDDHRIFSLAIINTNSIICSIRFPTQNNLKYILNYFQFVIIFEMALLSDLPA